MKYDVYCVLFYSSSIPLRVWQCFFPAPLVRRLRRCAATVFVTSFAIKRFQKAKEWDMVKHDVAISLFEKLKHSKIFCKMTIHNQATYRIASQMVKFELKKKEHGTLLRNLMKWPTRRPFTYSFHLTTRRLQTGFSSFTRNPNQLKIKSSAQIGASRDALFP